MSDRILALTMEVLEREGDSRDLGQRTMRTKGLAPRPANHINWMSKFEKTIRTCLAENGKVALFPASLVEISFRHVCGRQEEGSKLTNGVSNTLHSHISAAVQ